MSLGPLSFMVSPEKHPRDMFEPKTHLPRKHRTRLALHVGVQNDVEVFVEER